MIRLFIAIPIPEQITCLIAGMGRAIEGARPVAAEQIHLTLKFLGEVESSRLHDIDEVLTTIDFQSFALQLKGVGVFPPRGAPRVFWAGVAPREPVIALKNKIEHSLNLAGFPRESQKFSPHVTLARLRNPPGRGLHSCLAGNAFFETPRFVVAGFSLYSSKLTPKGALHTVERSYQQTR